MKCHRGKSVACFGMLFTLAALQGVQAEGLRGGFDDAFGPQFHPGTSSAQADAKQGPRHALDRAVVVRHWNQIALNASGLDHTPVAQGENRVFGEQLGPGRSSRAMAILHVAVFEVVNAIEGQYKSYVGLGSAKVGTSSNAAVSQAAHDTLVSLFPSQAAAFDGALKNELAEIPDGLMKANGIVLGKMAAAIVLAARAADGSQHSEPRVGIEFLTSNDPGKWRQDPLSQIPLALGAYWGKVKPFVLERADQFRAPVPPRLDSAEYATAYNEVMLLGGDGVITPTTRTIEQTKIGTYWAYDGTPSLCAPPRLYNQIAMRIAHQMGTDTDVLELARLLALVNVAMADTAIAVWESKYYYQYWRPVTGIRESDKHTGPSGLGDGNPDTVGDPAFSPLGAPASNLTGPNFTPPFPAYPSGHAGFGGAVFQILRSFYRTDRIAFTFVSDEYNGVTRGRSGVVRPLLDRSFSSLSHAEKENGQSRIYLGIHWGFDKTEGSAQGHLVAHYVFKNLFSSTQTR
jgi:membrane-associated phospholipid phosphatase